MSMFRRQDDVEYMSETDAALLRRGHPFAYVISVLIAVLVCVLLVWAHFAVLDEVTRGRGTVVPTRRVQEIQNLEGGILRDILVTEGQMVEKGDLLVRIDNELAQSRFREARSKSLENMAAIACLEAELDNREIVFPPEVAAEAPEVAERQKERYAAHKRGHEMEKNVLLSRYRQKVQEIREMRGRMAQLRESLSIAEDQLAIAEPMMKKKVYPKVEYLSLKQTAVTLKGDLQAIRLGLPRVQAAADEMKQQVAQSDAQYRSQQLDDLSRLRSELASLRETLSAGEDRVVRTELRSPVKGTVKQIMINTLGGVVKPGESIMEIVPSDRSLLIEARIRPSDIAFLRPGQKAVIKITAYDFSIYGGLEGKVSQISADTIAAEKGETYYLVKLRTMSNALRYKGKELPVLTGMTVDVDILTGHKSVLDYLLKPLMKAKADALRER